MLPEKSHSFLKQSFCIQNLFNCPNPWKRTKPVQESHNTAQLLIYLCWNECRPQLQKNFIITSISSFGLPSNVSRAYLLISLYPWTPHQTIKVLILWSNILLFHVFAENRIVAIYYGSSSLLKNSGLAIAKGSAMSDTTNFIRFESCPYFPRSSTNPDKIQLKVRQSFPTTTASQATNGPVGKGKTKRKFLNIH